MLYATQKVLNGYKMIFQQKLVKSKVICENTSILPEEVNQNNIINIPPYFPVISNLKTILTYWNTDILTTTT